VVKSNSYSPTDLGLHTNDTGTRIIDATPLALFLAVSKVARDRAAPCPWKNATQFGRRFSASLPLLREQGFDAEWSFNHHRSRLYSIVWRADTGALSIAGAGEVFTDRGPRLSDHSDAWTTAKPELPVEVEADPDAHYYDS